MRGQAATELSGRDAGLAFNLAMGPLSFTSSQPACPRQCCAPCNLHWFAVSLVAQTWRCWARFSTRWARRRTRAGAACAPCPVLWSSRRVPSARCVHWLGFGDASAVRAGLPVSTSRTHGATPAAGHPRTRPAQAVPSIHDRGELTGAGTLSCAMCICWVCCFRSAEHSCACHPPLPSMPPPTAPWRMPHEPTPVPIPSHPSAGQRRCPGSAFAHDGI